MSGLRHMTCSPLNVPRPVNRSGYWLAILLLIASTCCIRWFRARWRAQQIILEIADHIDCVGAHQAGTMSSIAQEDFIRHILDIYHSRHIIVSRLI